MTDKWAGMHWGLLMYLLMPNIQPQTNAAQKSVLRMIVIMKFQYFPVHYKRQRGTGD